MSLLSRVTDSLILQEWHRTNELLARAVSALEALSPPAIPAQTSRSRPIGAEDILISSTERTLELDAEREINSNAAFNVFPESGEPSTKLTGAGKIRQQERHHAAATRPDWADA